MKSCILSGYVLDNHSKKGIADVSVTNGRDVVKTDKNGFYEISKWEKGSFITVTTASGYVCKSFYHVIKENVKQYNFYFEESKIKKAQAHSFIQISDTEIGTESETGWLDEVKELIEENEPAFLIHTGDICYEYGLKNHLELMNSENMGCPVYYVIGNHDYVDGDYGEQLYEQIYGPVCYSFEVGDTHYAVTPIHYGDFSSKFSSKDRWQWLKNDLKNTNPYMKLVIFNHTKSPTEDYVLPLDFGSLDLKKYNLKAWIFGHYHYNYIDEKHGVLNISTARPDCGGIDSSPAGIRLINVNKDGITTKMYYRDLGCSTKPEGADKYIKLSGNALFCDTILNDSKLYAATSCDDRPVSCGVYCVNPENMDIIWFYKTKNSIKNNLVISGNKIIAMNTQGRLYCLDKNSGELIWEQSVGVGEALGTSSAMTIGEETLFAGSSMKISAVDMRNGNVKWSLNTDRGENSPAEFVLDREKLLVSSHWNALACIDAAKGKLKWTNDDENLRFRSSTPTFINSKTILAADSNAIMMINSQNGNIEFKKVFENIDFSSSAKPAIYNNIAYIATASSGVVGFDIAEKKLVCKIETGSSILFTAPYSGIDSMTVEATPTVFEDELYFGANDGFIYSVDLKTNRLKKKYNAGSAVLGKVAVTKTQIYACAFNGYLISFKK